MNILSAKYITRDSLAAIAITENEGAVLVTPENNPKLWARLSDVQAYAPPVESNDEKQAKKTVLLAAIDAASTRAIRELVLDQAGIVSLTTAERAAARDRLKQENDKANSERAK